MYGRDLLVLLMAGCSAAVLARTPDQQISSRGRLEAAPPAPAQPDVKQAAELIARLSNQFRSENHRSPAHVDIRLKAAAEAFAHYMAETDTYGHTADGRTPAGRAAASGYDFCLVEENIAFQYSSAGFTTQQLARRFFQGWRDSPEHRQNMLKPDMMDTGVGLAHSARSGRYYAVQMFGRPKSASVRFEVVNHTRDTLAYAVDDKPFSLPPQYTRTHALCSGPRLTFKPGAGAQDKNFQARDSIAYVAEPTRSGEYAIEERPAASK